MPQASGELALAFQAAKGASAAAPAFRFPLAGGNLPGPLKATGVENYVGTTRIAREAYVVAVPAEGSPEAIARPRMLGALLYAVLGAKAAAGSADPWTHTFTLASTLPWLTVWRHFAGILTERLDDARISRLVISSRAGGELRVAFTVLSGSPVHRLSPPATPAFETSLFLHHHGAGALRVEGVAVASIAEWVLSIDANLRLVQTLAGLVPRPNGRATITLQARQAVVDAALWKRLVYSSATPGDNAGPTLTPLELGGSPAGADFTLTAAASPERSIKLALPRLAVLPIEGLANPSTRAEPAWMTGTYQALAPAAGSPLTATLRNDLAAY